MKTWPAAPGTTIRCSAGPVSKATTCSRKRPPRPGCTIRRARCSTRSTPAGAGRTWSDKIEHRPLDYPKIWRMAQGKTRKPVKFGTCCSQVMALFLDIHTPKYKDKRQVIWDMAEAMNKELLALRDAGCRCIQIEEPTFHFMANTYGKDHEEVKFMIDAFNREVQGLDDVELWIHTCWGNPNMQRVMEDTSYANSIEIYLERCRGDVWTLEMKDRNQQRSRAVRAVQARSEEEDLHRRGQPSRAAGGPAGGRRGRDPQGAEVHSRRAADRVERLRLRPPGLQSRDRVLQGERDRAGLQHRPQRTRLRHDLRARGRSAAAARRRSRPQDRVKHVALLRGINVGGKNIVPMKELAAVFTAAGCRDVTTYIQSGNVIFTASASVLKKSPAIVFSTAFNVPTVIRSHDELAAAISGNPYLAEDI